LKAFMTTHFTTPDCVAADVQRALDEDIRTGDLTALLIDAKQQAHGRIIAREPAILCGQPWFDAAFRQVEPSVQITWHVAEGDAIEPNQVLVEMSGSARALVTAERTALNFLQLLSGTATTVNTYVKAIAGTKTHVVDSRKTIPGLRLAQKYAVVVGGGVNHRVGLYDGILIKENHIATAGGVTPALEHARAIVSAPDVAVRAVAPFIQIEVETLVQLQEALSAGAQMILLDNMNLEHIAQAVKINTEQFAKQAILEVSGNVSLDNIRGYAELGVDRVSIGGLTKHVRAIDFSMRVNAV
jgi:nicotinate-nucleotide pyrophosphorylase (carboxylating)